jgi:hypothetical protein
MKERTVSPTAQIIALAALLAALGAAVAAQLPELQRYLKMRSM